MLFFSHISYAMFYKKKKLAIYHNQVVLNDCGFKIRMTFCKQESSKMVTKFYKFLGIFYSHSVYDFP